MTGGVVHRPGCCQRGCPAVARGRDPAGCALRLTGTCGGCDCPAGYPPPVGMVWDRAVGWRVIYDVVPDLGEWDAITRMGDQEPPAMTP